MAQPEDDGDTLKKGKKRQLPEEARVELEEIYDKLEEGAKYKPEAERISNKYALPLDQLTKWFDNRRQSERKG